MLEWWCPYHLPQGGALDHTWELRWQLPARGAATCLFVGFWSRLDWALNSTDCLRENAAPMWLVYFTAPIQRLLTWCWLTT
jgi:hypothetical protein